MSSIAILGSTGSIGRSALEVAAAAPHEFRIVALAAHRRTDELADQARRFRPRVVAISDPEAAAAFDRKSLPPGCQLETGPSALDAIAALPEVEVVLAAIVGSAGLRSTWAALAAGKRVALANKETLVVGGQSVVDHARRHGAELVPVDSEHSAVFQAMQSGARGEVRRIVLTASGGPFLRHSPEQLARVTVTDALAHPTWNMGRKITVDSATLMNKALEIVEARWLFGLAPEQIEVVIHPQSIVHSLVEFVDGSVLAQLSPPDMKLPIQYALTWPRRIPCPAPSLDWRQALELTFEPADAERFPALALGYEVAKAGGTAGAVLNAANEEAVRGFLDGELPFTEIIPLCRSVLEQHAFESRPSLQRLLELDAWAREEVARWACT